MTELMVREDSDKQVQMIYHGKDASPKLTVEVFEYSTGAIYVLPADEGTHAMDMFNHPMLYVGGLAA
jgi:hypothetical protein